MTAGARPAESPLEAHLRRCIRRHQGLDFAQFMELCLYHPEYGYYMTPRERIGKQGDFFTSSSVHALFGALIARQLEQMWRLLGAGPFTLAEQGAGEGHLAKDVLDAVAAQFPEFYRQLRYALVEISPENRRRQQALLSAHGERLQWCDPADLAGLEGCLLSNELVDAFPVHLLEKQDGRLKEVFVVERQGRISEELRPLTNPAILEHLHQQQLQPVEGNRCEINLRAADWMRSVGRLLRRGFVLTIDYGYPAAELYAPFRRNGTLMCFSRHSSSDDPYQRFGEQDITAHVDFTALERCGAEVGLEPLYFGEQYRFLMGLGFVEALMDLQAREVDPRKAQALRMTLKNLILPDGGMGGTFKVLIQGKGVGHPTLLCRRSMAAIAAAAGALP